MVTLGLITDVEKSGFACLAHLTEEQRNEAIIHLSGDVKLEIGAMPRGMESGKASIMFAFPLPDGQVVIAETSLALLKSAVAAFVAAHETPTNGSARLPGAEGSN